MCCRNGPRRYQRRQPLVVALGALAYKKYQDNKAARAIPEQADQPQLQRRSSPPPHVLEREANNEIMEKAGIAPPSYDYAVRNSPSSPFSLNKDGYEVKRTRSHSSSSGSDDLSDAESLAELDAAPTDFVSRSRADRADAEELEFQEEPTLTKWQQKRADRMARKAEKAARKAGRAAMGL